MYRLLIADDEALEREGIEWIVKRMMPDTFEIIHAENGRTAIRKAEEFHPHIVMMDIRMPGIQGLEALKEIKARHPHVKMVLVTAYEYFGYAKEAISLGVHEYLVKPAKRDQIAVILQRLVAEIEQEQRKRNDELAVRDKLFQLLPLAEAELALVFMTDQVNEIELEHLADMLELSIDHGCALVLALPELGTEKKKTYETVKNAVKGALNERLGYAISPMVHRHMAVFLLDKPQTGDEVIREAASQLGGELIEVLERRGIAISVGIGSVGAGMEGIRRSYFEGVFASTYDNQMGSLHRFDDLNVPSSTGARGENARSVGDFCSESDYVEQAIKQIREEREQRTGNVLDRAVSFIRERYLEELSLEDVADHVHLNPYYFSKVFKQQTGETFIDYVTRLRIEKAKELMKDGQLSLKEVCYRVGYKDPNYFSRVFKKVTGVTPSEHRVQLQ